MRTLSILTVLASLLLSVIPEGVAAQPLRAGVGEVGEVGEVGAAAFDVRARYSWMMHDFEDRDYPASDLAVRKASSLAFAARLYVTPIEGSRVRVRLEMARIEYSDGDVRPRAKWLIDLFADRDRLVESFRRYIVLYKPVFRFADAALYEAETLGLMLALMDGQSIEIDLDRPTFFLDPLQGQTDELLAEWAPDWPRDAGYDDYQETIWGAGGGERRVGARCGAGVPAGPPAAAVAAVQSDQGSGAVRDEA